jgi:hypothetical protein
MGNPKHSLSQRERASGCMACREPSVVTLRLLQSWLRRRAGVVSACAAFGTAYGAAFGALFGLLCWTGAHDGPAAATASGAIGGAVLGASGGVVAGLVGKIIGGSAGWCLAGALGRAIPAMPFALYLLVVASANDERVQRAWLLPCPAVVLIGSFLGFALASGLRRGRSPVPGVQRLATIIRDGKLPIRPAEAHGPPTEVAPCAAPAGRGDEAAPLDTG